MSKRIKISQIVKDDKNFNKHTTEGLALLEKSIETVGVIESITISADEKIITGNARHQKMTKVFGDDVEPIYIETDGKRPVIIKRTDIQSDTKEFHQAALLANTTAVKNINLDLDLIQEIMCEQYEVDIEELGIDLTGEQATANVKEDNYEPQPPKKPKSKIGDIYQLGDHRLLCGNTTEPVVI